MLAEATSQIIARGSDYLSERKGLYNLAGSGYASRVEWAKMTLELDPNNQEQITKEILPAKTADFPTPAQRPKYTAMDCQKFMTAFGLYIPLWEASLYLAMNTPEDFASTSNMKFHPRSKNGF